MAGKPSPPVPRKIRSTGSKISPPTPRKISNAANNTSPPTPCKVNSTAGKMSPPTPRKSCGLATKTSPQCPPQLSDARQTEASEETAKIIENVNSAARTVDVDSPSDKSKPPPPKKPLPSLPKGMTSPGEVASSKPPLPHKPLPDLASTSKTDSSQPSVAALAQKLSTNLVFPFNTGKPGGIFPSPGNSPRASPHSSPRPSPRNVPSSSAPEKSDSKVVVGTAKPNEVSKPKLLPRPGTSPQKSPSQPSSPRLGKL